MNVQVKVISNVPIIITGKTRYPGHIHTISETAYKQTMIDYPNSLEITPQRQEMVLREIVPPVTIEPSNESEQLETDTVLVKPATLPKPRNKRS